MKIADTKEVQSWKSEIRDRVIHIEEKINVLINESRTNNFLNTEQDFGGRTYSQSGDDVIVLNIFRNLGQTRFSYLDIGAHHPYTISNTALLYQQGCRGVNVEANPNLIENFIKYRPEDINLNMGVGEKSGKLSFYMIDDWSGRNTFSKEIMDEFLKRNPQFKLQEVKEIEITTLDEIIKNYCNNLFPDFLSIDIEGLDYQVLSSFDLKNKGPKVIDVEDTSEEMLKLMQANEYEMGIFTGNGIFVKRKYHKLAMLGRD